MLARRPEWGTVGGVRDAGDKPPFGDRPTFGSLPGDDHDRGVPKAADDLAELEALMDEGPTATDSPDDRGGERSPSPADPPAAPSNPRAAAQGIPEPLRGPVHPSSRPRWPSVAAAAVIGAMAFGGVAALIGDDDSTPAIPPVLQVPGGPVSTGPVLPAGTEQWVADAQLALAKIREELAAIEAVERVWNAQPAGRREGQLPPPVVELHARKALLQQQEARLVADLAAIGAAHESARQVRELEAQLGRLEAVSGGASPPTTAARQVDEREAMLREQLRTEREELGRWESGAQTAVDTPLPELPPVEPVTTAVIDLTRQSEDPTPDNTPDPTTGITPSRELELTEIPDGDGDDPEPDGPPEPDGLDDLSVDEPVPSNAAPAQPDGVLAPVNEAVDSASSVVDSAADAVGSVVASAEPDVPAGTNIRRDAPVDTDTDVNAEVDARHVPADATSVDPDALYEQLERLDGAVGQLDQELDRTLDVLRPHTEQGGDLGESVEDAGPPETGSPPGSDLGGNIAEDDPTTGGGDAACECDPTAQPPAAGSAVDVPSSSELAETSDKMRETTRIVAARVAVTGELHITDFHYDAETRTGDAEINGSLTVTDKATGESQTISFTDDDGAGQQEAPRYLPGSIQKALDNAQSQPAGYTSGSIQQALAGPA